MKSLFITFALVVSFSTLVSAQQQAPLDYQYARRDDGVQSNKTVPGNVWGGSNGMGTKWCNTAYNTPANPAGICIWRLTDATVFPSGPGVQTPENDAQNENVTVQTDDNQKDNIISIYNGTTRYVVVRSTGGKNAIVAFDPTQPNPVTLTGFNSPGELMFDDSNSGIIYARVNHTQIQKYVSTDGWKTYTATPIYDFANCLPPGYSAQWQGAWGSATTTSLTTGTHHTWGSAFSDKPDQGTGYEAVVYKEGVNGAGAGCARIDTQAGMAYDWNGNLLGPLDDGNGGSIPSFTLHEGGMYRNPGYFGLSPANSCQNCASAYFGR